MYRETWGIEFERIEEFFDSQPDVRRKEGGFEYNACVIALTGLPAKKLGSVEIPQTLVEMTGGSGDAEAIHRRFFMRFLSAGG